MKLDKCSWCGTQADEVDGKVIAFFFSKEKAQEYLDWQNEARKNRSATTEDEG